MNGIEVCMSGKEPSSLSAGDREARGKGSGVGPAIAAARAMQGFSQKQLAERIGVPVGELGLVEAGKKRPDLNFFSSWRRGFI